MPLGYAAVPEPVRDVTEEAALALYEALSKLFDTYPPDDFLALPAVSTREHNQKPAVFCRDKALSLITSGRCDVKDAAYWACDTGVPNDEILAVYTLLFG